MLSILSLVMALVTYRGLSLSLPRVISSARHRTPLVVRRTRRPCVDMSMSTLSPAVVGENRVLGELAGDVVQGRIQKVSNTERGRAEMACFVHGDSAGCSLFSIHVN